jgi:hypothetical protein
VVLFDGLAFSEHQHQYDADNSDRYDNATHGGHKVQLSW